METKKRALGRGLESLFNDENLDLEQMEKQIYDDSKGEEIIEVSLNELRPNPYQPRKIFNDEALSELAESIKEHGVFQPIIIKKSIRGYEIIAGERRVRASKIAGLEKIPAIIRNFTDEQMMEIALLENLQRENLSALEEAEAYDSILKSLCLTHEELAKKIGKSRSHVTNMLGLLKLPKEVQDMIIKDELSMAHARVLSKLENNDKILELAEKITSEKMSVHDLEDLSRESDLEKKVKFTPTRKQKNSEYKYVEDMLRQKLDTKVRVKERKIEITYTSVHDLNRILEIMDVKE